MKKTVLFFLLMGSVCCAWGQRASDLLQQAKVTPDPRVQILLLSNAIERAPRMVNAYHYRGDAYRTLKEYRSAVADYSRAIQLRPKDPFRYYARGLAYTDMHRYSSAIADFSQAITLKPSYTDFYLARARAYAADKKYTQAVSDYQRYTAKRPKKKSGLLGEMIPVYAEAYRYNEADALIEQALQRGDDSAEIYYWQGRVRAGQNRLDEAVSSYSKAMNRRPDWAAPYRYRAGVFKNMGELEASLEDYTSLLALQPDPLFYNRRGIVNEELKNFKAAESDYSQAIELNPKWAIPYTNRGFVRMHLKNWSAAQKDLEQSIRLDGATPTPYINLAGVNWLWKKDRKQAYKNLDKAVQRNFKDFESLYNEEQKGWMFKGLNQTSQFRSLLYR